MSERLGAGNSDTPDFAAETLMELVCLADVIMAGLPASDAMSLSQRLRRAVPPGADLSLIRWRFLLWLLTDVSTNGGIHRPSVRDAASDVAQMMGRLAAGEALEAGALRKAARNARKAANASDPLGRSAAWTAWEAAVSGEGPHAAEKLAEAADRVAQWSKSPSRAFRLMAQKLTVLMEQPPGERAVVVYPDEGYGEDLGF